MVVFYGSQTGTAEEFAGRLSKDAQRYGLKGMVADPEECEMVRQLGMGTCSRYNTRYRYQIERSTILFKIGYTYTA